MQLSGRGRGEGLIRQTKSALRISRFLSVCCVVWIFRFSIGNSTTGYRYRLSLSVAKMLRDVTLLVLLFLGLGNAVSAAAGNFRRGKLNSIPKYYFEPSTTKYCMWWLDNTDGDWTCERIKEELEVSMVDFHEWVCMGLELAERGLMMNRTLRYLFRVRVFRSFSRTALPRAVRRSR